jgi:tRNA A-37 threonylcarbamoyl transferase component Bud32
MRGDVGESSNADCLREETVMAFLDGTLASEDARRVEEHIDACGECRALLAEMGRSLAPSVSGPLPEGATEAEPGRALERGGLVGRYRLLGPLGSGSMGIVYAAYDPQLGRRIALKLVRPRAQRNGESGERSRGRVLREAQAMARLAHPNVVAIHDVGTFGDEVFLAMELVEGTLASVLEAGTPSPGWQEILALFLQAGEGLAAAHDEAIVHRDFKPENVLVGRDGRPRVCDFGLARSPAPMRPEALPPDDLAANAIATATRGLVGTPAYMAPEQLRGEHAGPPADVFAFSVALYEALHGERPFAGSSVPELRRAIEAGQVRRPPPMSLSARAVPRTVRECILRGLAANPKARPTMRQLLADLRRAGAPRSGARPLRLALLATPLAAAGAIAMLVSRGQGAPAGAAEARITAAPPPMVAVAVTTAAAPASSSSTAPDSIPPAATTQPPPAASHVTQAAVGLPSARRQSAITAALGADAAAPAPPASVASTPSARLRPLFDDPY